MTLEEFLRKSVECTKDNLDFYLEECERTIKDFTFFGAKGSEHEDLYSKYDRNMTAYVKVVSALDVYLKYKNSKPCIASRIRHKLLNSEDKAWAELVGALDYEDSGWNLEEYGGMFFLSKDLGGGISIMVEKGGRRFSMECEVVGAFALEISPKDLEAFSKYFNRE